MRGPRQRVYTDASFKDGRAGIAAVIEWQSGDVFVSKFIKTRGPNQAEYEAAILGCEMARHHRSQLVVVTDSELMFKQFNDEVKARGKIISSLLRDLKSLASEVLFDPKNKKVRKADRLSRYILRSGNAN